MTNEKIRLHRELKTFTTFAYLFGVIVPFLGVSFWDYINHKFYGYELAFSGPTHFILVITALVPFVLCFYIQSYLFGDMLNENGLSKIKKWLYVLGIATSLLMGGIIFLTGGILKSLFSFYLIYLPSIVAVAFTPSEESKGRGVMFISFSCALVIIVCLFFNIETSQYSAFQKTQFFKLCYMFISILQLGVIVLLKRKSVLELVKSDE